MKFDYEAMNATGQEHKGVIEAISESKANELIRNEGFFVTRMKKHDPNAKSNALYYPKAEIGKSISNQLHLPSIVIFVGGMLCGFLIAKLMN
jgi:type II secretory pathway component PulF